MIYVSSSLHELLVSPSDTSDVQTAVIESVNSQSLKVTCTFAVGTQTRGCRVQILRTNDPQNPYYTLNVERSTTNPLVAEATDAMQFPSEAFEVIAFDWESDGTISNFGIPVEVIGGPIPPSSAAPSKRACECECVSGYTLCTYPAHYSLLHCI